MQRSSDQKDLLVVEDLRVWHSIRKLFSVVGYIKAVDGVSFSVPHGMVFSIVGESGCGKSTLVRAILGLVPITGGRILFDGVDITSLPRSKLRRWYTAQVGFIQQDPYGAMPPFMTIKGILEEPMKIHGVPKHERLERIRNVLADVGLTPPEEYLNKYPHMLSGGQLQRVAIARALVLRPKLILADEPVSMLDASVRIGILSLLRDLREKYSASVIYITHDFATAKYFSDTIAVMYAGQFVEIGSSHDVIYNPKHPYTQALLNVLPDPDPKNRFIIRKTLPGEPPNLMNPPPGCRLAPRCPYVMDRCRTEEPPMVEVKTGARVKCWLYV